MRILLLTVLLSLSLTASVCGQQQIAQGRMLTATQAASIFATYPTLEAQAKEFGDAYVRKDNERLLELSYPKMIENVGRQNLLNEILQGEHELQTYGLEVLSWTPRDATEVLSDSGSLYAVVPTTMKMKRGESVSEEGLCLIAISNDEGHHWTFVSRNCVNLDEMFPQIATKLKSLSGKTSTND